MPAYHVSAVKTAYSFEVGLQRAAGNVADILIASHEAHREDAMRARVVWAEVARVRAHRAALAARHAAEEEAHEREVALQVAVLRRKFAARHASRHGRHA